MSSVRWLPVVLWAGVILTATSLPNVPASPGHGADKMAHLAMYGILGALALRAAWATARSARRLVLTLLSIALFAAIDEWHQAFIPNRSADPADWVADVAGATIGIGSLAAFKFRRIQGT